MFCGGVCVMYMVWIYCDPWKNFYMTRICCVRCLIGSSMCLSFCGMMCCGMWVGDRSQNDLFMSHCHCHFCIYNCGSGISIYVCLDDHSNGAYHNDYCKMWIYHVISCLDYYPCALLVYLMVGFCLGSPLQHVHTHHNQSTIYEGNSMPCVPILDTGNICPHH